MAKRPTPHQITTYVRSGPGGSAAAVSAEDVLWLAKERSDLYDNALKKLGYTMAEQAFKHSVDDVFQKYRDFTGPWIDRINHPASRLLKARLNAYESAWNAGMGDLRVDSSPDDARAVSERIARLYEGSGNLTEVQTLALRGQVESLWSRDVAGQTFEEVRGHPKNASLAKSWDQGALSYFNSNQVFERSRSAENIVGTVPEVATSKSAFVISVDPVFFRIYAPMFLFNAQQIPEVDLVLLVCAGADEAGELIEESRQYLEALSRMNKQNVPRNVHFHAFPVPDWVGDRTTFYACARFLALPQILEQYEYVYSIDADLIMRYDPTAFFRKTAKVVLSFPHIAGSLGMVPWRRYMAGNLVATQKLLGASFIGDLESYITAGLDQPRAWTLDQNALAYAVERGDPGVYEPLENYSRPLITSTFMNRWERNYVRATR